MKKFTIILAALLVVFALTSCGAKKEENKIKVAATLDPHSKVLEFAKPILKEEHGIDLEISVLDDYYIFNKALEAGEIDANYFQHVPFFNDEIANNGYDIVNVGGVHIEPFGFYSKSIKSVDELKEGDTIIISTSISDYGRLLGILDKAGVIKLKEGVNLITATFDDIAENPKKIQFKEVKPELLSLSYENKEGALVAINGNYAIVAGLNPLKDAVLLEEGDEDNPYVNIVACKKGHEDSKEIKALVEVLKSDKVKKFIQENYSNGSVIPAK